MQTQRVNVEPGGSSSATFEPVTVAERNMRASVRLPNDALERDNVFNFVRVAGRAGAGHPRRARRRAARRQPVPGARAGGRRRRRGSRSRPAAPTRCRTKTSPARRSSCSTMLPWRRRTAERLARFVEGGGGLFVVAGERAGWSGPPAIAAWRSRQRRRPQQLASRRGSGRSSTGTRRSRCSARRGPATSPRRASTDIVPSRRAPAHRCWRASTTARRRCWSGGAAAAAC